jgi:hypothetical protein
VAARCPQPAGVKIGTAENVCVKGARSEQQLARPPTCSGAGFFYLSTKISDEKCAPTTAGVSDTCVAQNHHASVSISFIASEKNRCIPVLIETTFGL